MADILGVETLFAQLVLAIGAALLLGNGLALWKHHRGRRPPGAEGPLRRGRAVFLTTVGLLMTSWGLLTLLAG